MLSNIHIHHFIKQDLLYTINLLSIINITV